jgi:DNA-binding transcriptional ArsR family regulator
MESRPTRNISHALDNPIRRRILRTLHGGVGGERTLEELTALNPDVSMSKINYHLLTLVDCHCTALEPPISADLRPRHRSLVATDKRVLETLQHSLGADECERS